MEITMHPRQLLLDVVRDIYTNGTTSGWGRLVRDPPEGSAPLGRATDEMLALLVGCDTILTDLETCRYLLAQFDEGRTPCGRRLNAAEAIIQIQLTEQHQARLRGLLEAFIGLFNGVLGGEHPGHPAEGAYTLTAERLIFFTPGGPASKIPPVLSILGVSPDDPD